MFTTLYPAPSARPFLRLLRLCVVVGTTFMAAACGDDSSHEVKNLKSQVQRAYGNKEFAKALGLAQKGLTLSRKTAGDKAPDTLYFVQAISEANLYMHNTRGAIMALRDELAMRTAAGQKEDKLQPRRTMLIQLAEENGDPMTAGAQAALISKGIDMAPGKDPQPVYQARMTAHVNGEGDVEMSYSLDSNGAVTSASIIKSTPPQVFDQVALETFKKWRFTPMLDQSGRPVSASGFKFTMMIRQR